MTLAMTPPNVTAALADLRHVRVELGHDAWTTARTTREPTLADVQVGLDLCNLAIPLAPGKIASEIRIVRGVLASIAVRTGFRGGVRGLDVPMLRGCLDDLHVMLA